VADEDLDVRIRLRGGQRFAQGVRQDARAIDDLGDKARRAGRGMSQLSRSSASARVQLGPFSTRLRVVPLLIGGAIVGLERLTPALVGAAEGFAAAGAGAGAAGAVGITAYVQAAGTAALATRDVSDALGGNTEAYSRLTAAQRRYVDDLAAMQPVVERLRGAAARGLLPGLGGGIEAAARNAPVLERVLERTGRAMGGVAEDAGELVGSRAFGRDFERIGAANAAVVDDLGHAGISLGSALRHLLVEAGPLARWLSENVRQGARLLDVWIAGERHTGDLAGFFEEARDNLESLGRASANIAGGVVNLFGAGDVDGTRTLRNFERLTERFERWTESPAVRAGLADAITAEIPDAVGAVVTSLAENLPGAGLAAGKVFWESFWASNIEGKAFIAAVTGAKIAGAVRGTTPLTPMFVKEVAPGVGVGPGGGRGRGGPRVPPWLGRAGARALPVAGAAATAWWLSGVLPDRNLPTRGGAPRAREQAGRPGRGAQRGALERVPDPARRFQPPPLVLRDPRDDLRGEHARAAVLDVRAPIVLKVNDREVARANARFRARERARGARRAP
jgi:hypothetical protein